MFCTPAKDISRRAWSCRAARRSRRDPGKGGREGGRLFLRNWTVQGLSQTKAAEKCDSEAGPAAAASARPELRRLGLVRVTGELGLKVRTEQLRAEPSHKARVCTRFTLARDFFFFFFFCGLNCAAAVDDRSADWNAAGAAAAAGAAFPLLLPLK